MKTITNNCLNIFIQISKNIIASTVVVETKGGKMEISKDESGDVIVKGPAEYAFSGKIDIY